MKKTSFFELINENFREMLFRFTRCELFTAGFNCRNNIYYIEAVRKRILVNYFEHGANELSKCKTITERESFELFQLIKAQLHQ